MVISAGVNDIAFGPILEYCLKWSGPTACEDTDITVNTDKETGVITSFSWAARGSKLTLYDEIAKLLGGLPKLYDDLDTALSDSSLTDNGAKIYITQYPTFTYQGGAGDYCDSTFDAPLVVWRWIASVADELNDEVRVAAKRFHWTLVVVPESYFYNHGYCVLLDSWFVGLAHATAAGNFYGAFHPTNRGAHVTAVLLLEKMCPLLSWQKACTKFPTP